MKIDLGELYKNKATLDSSVKNLKSTIQSARDYLQALADSEALQGKVKTAIDAKLKNHQIPLMTNYLTALSVLSKDYTTLLQTFKDTVGEKSNRAIIDTDALRDLKKPFSGIEQGLSVIQRETAAIYESIADIIELANPSTSKVIQDLHAAKQVLTDTESKMAAFNQLQSRSSFEEMMAAQTKELRQLSALQGLSYTDKEALKLYQSQKFLYEVADNVIKGNNQARQVQLQKELAAILKSQTPEGRKSQRDKAARKTFYARFTRRIDNMSLQELKQAFPYVNALIPQYAAFSFSVEQTKCSDYVIKRYWYLIKQQSVSERSTCFMEDYGKYISETGKNPFTGKPVLESERMMAKYYGTARGLTTLIGGTSSLISAYVGYQNYYGSPVYGVQTNFAGEKNILNDTNFNKKVTVKNDFGNYSTKIDNHVNVIEKTELPKWVADSFLDNEYRTVLTKENIIVYRTFGGSADAGGTFVTTNKATSRIDAKIDTALLPEWKNTRMYEARIIVPKNQRLNIGKVAPQIIEESGTILDGGGDQIMLPKEWPLDWIKEIRVVPN
ncbi:T7SS effector LXG polymorphic toxin [Streptococcus intermedius]|uniref:T7SS effector LXG polymorphic toxin n=1 Tax=Streptococcus intermedius TaxID=1338 RepID=UPI001F079902|nr:T7SS effector LXG polymorphic toxin [Streptococcus intermedius]